MIKDGTNMQVKFYTQGGRQTQSIQIYKDIDSLVPDADDQGRKTYSIKNNEYNEIPRADKYPTAEEPEMKEPGVGKIEIAGVELAPNEVQKLTQILDPMGDEEAKVSEMPGDPKFVLQQTIADAKMNALMGETLAQKQNIISALEDELNKERNRRKQMSKDYKTQVREFELDKKALDGIKKKSEQMEKNKAKREAEELKKDSELDMVPTRERSSKKSTVPKNHRLQEHPIFFKNSKIESRIPK